MPVRTTRSRETYAGLAHEFRPNARMIYEMLVRPCAGCGPCCARLPAFCHHDQYAPPGSSSNEIIAYARQHMGGAFTWEEVKRYAATSGKARWR